MLRFWSINHLVSYDEMRDFQLNLVDLRSKDLIPDTLLFLEHEPVITRGRGLQKPAVLKPDQEVTSLRSMPLLQPLPPGIQFAESERGGDLTYHGPGQLVIYPIFKLDGRGFSPERDIAAFLRKLEQVFIRYLNSLGLEAGMKADATGVWVGSKKIASIGIAIRKWVSYHGIAMNCVNDLKPFYLISPCGFSPEVMTRLKDWTDLGEDSNWRIPVERDLAKLFAQAASQDSEAVRSASLSVYRAELPKLSK